MNDVKRILKVADSDIMKVVEGFKDLLHTHLVSGQTDYVCEYGTLGSNHGNFTDEQRYFATFNEMWTLFININMTKATTFERQAEIKEADADMASSKKEVSKLLKEAKILRAQCKKLRAQVSIMSDAVTIETQERMLKTYDRIRKELAPKVEAMFPYGIEQASPKMWEDRFRMTAMKANGENISHFPMPIERKAQLGLETGRIEACAPLRVVDQDKFKDLLDQRTVKIETQNVVSLPHEKLGRK